MQVIGKFYQTINVTPNYGEKDFHLRKTLSLYSHYAVHEFCLRKLV